MQVASGEPPSCVYDKDSACTHLSLPSTIFDLMALQIFDFDANCTKSVELYNGLFPDPLDMLSLLRDLLLPDRDFLFVLSTIHIVAHARGSLM